VSGKASLDAGVARQKAPAPAIAPRRAATKLRQQSRYVLFAPTHKGEQHLAQRAALPGKRVGVPHWTLLIGSAAEDAGTFQTLGDG
jgi:hypothetical protein